MALSCSVCGETLAAEMKHCPFCGSTAQQSQAVATQVQEPAQALTVPQPPVLVISEPPAPTPAASGKARMALFLEIIGGLIGFLGIGHIYTGRPVLGIALLIGWLVIRQSFLLAALLSGGLLALIAIPIAIGVPIYSGMAAEKYTLGRR